MKDDLFRPDLEQVLLYYDVDLPFSYSGVGWVVILCPAHGERRPSCTVNLDLGKIHCHACGFHGDALDLICERETLGLRAASTWASENFAEASGGGVRGRPDRLSRRGVSGGAGHLSRDRKRSSSRLRTRTRWD